MRIEEKAFRFAQTAPGRQGGAGVGWCIAAFAIAACWALVGGEASGQPTTQPSTRRAAGPVASHVIHLSVDGLRPDAILALGPADATNFYRLRREGAFTHNARTDADWTITAPNHTTQLTGHRVEGDEGHRWIGNDAVDAEHTLHVNRGQYLASVFDVAHDRGLRTAALVGKGKLAIYRDSYDGVHGAPDLVGQDDGRDKIDHAVVRGPAAEVAAALAELWDDEGLPHYTFIHFRDPDVAGHAEAWSIEPGSAYLAAVREVDAQLGVILRRLDADPQLAARTTLIVTADHGGVLGSRGHGDAADAGDYTIPFYVWGAGVAAGDLYAMNPASRRDPAQGRPGYDDVPQPIRNGDAANLALDLLGLRAVPGSTINARQDLAVTAER